MKLLFNKENIEFEQIPSVEELIEKVTELLSNKFYFSHFIMDGKEIKEEPELFLIKHISDIKSLEVVAIQAKEFVNNLLLSAEEYTWRAIPHIITLVDEFYNNPSSSSWVRLDELFEGIQWLSSMIEIVDKSAVRPTNWDKVLTHTSAMQGELRDIEEAIENTDTVLIADMLQYEILPVFEAFSIEMKKAIDTEGIRHDFN